MALSLWRKGDGAFIHRFPVSIDWRLTPGNGKLRHFWALPFLGLMDFPSSGENCEAEKAGYCYSIGTSSPQLHRNERWIIGVESRAQKALLHNILKLKWLPSGRLPFCIPFSVNESTIFSAAQTSHLSSILDSLFIMSYVFFAFVQQPPNLYFAPFISVTFAVIRMIF